MQYPSLTDITSRLRRLWRFLTVDRDERRGVCPACGLPLSAPTERAAGRLAHAGECASRTWEAAQW